MVHDTEFLRTLQVAHASGICGNFVSLLVLDIVSGLLEGGDHLLSAGDASTGDLAGNLGGLAAVGVDDAALVGSHVHVLLAVSIGDPSINSY